MNATELNLLLGPNCINRIGILTTKATATVFIKIMMMSKYQHVLFRLLTSTSGSGTIDLFQVFHVSASVRDPENEIRSVQLLHQQERPLFFHFPAEKIRESFRRENRQQKRHLRRLYLQHESVMDQYNMFDQGVK
jgi:hypothetical protein